MKSDAIILLQGDSSVSRNLADSFAKIFRTVHVTSSLPDALTAVIKHKANVAVVDMEVVSSGEIEQFLSELPHLRVVCNHRIADDELWMTALNAGAADCCISSDIKSIVNAALRQSGHAAAA